MLGDRLLLVAGAMLRDIQIAAVSVMMSDGSGVSLHDVSGVIGASDETNYHLAVDLPISHRLLVLGVNFAGISDVGCAGQLFH